MKLVNLTPHPIDLFASDSLSIYDPHSAVWPTAPPARLAEHIEPHCTVQVGGILIPIVTVSYSLPTGLLPPILPDTLLIVPRLVADLLQRNDLVYPHQLIRDNNHKVVGCKALGRFAERSYTCH